jgi:hypothetical protein
MRGARNLTHQSGGDAKEGGREGIDALPELAIVLGLGLGDGCGGGHGCGGAVLFASPPPLRPRNKARSASSVGGEERGDLFAFIIFL